MLAVTPAQGILGSEPVLTRKEGVCLQEKEWIIQPSRAGYPPGSAPSATQLPGQSDNAAGEGAGCVLPAPRETGKRAIKRPGDEISKPADSATSADVTQKWAPSASSGRALREFPTPVSGTKSQYSESRATRLEKTSAQTSSTNPEELTAPRCGFSGILIGTRMPPAPPALSTSRRKSCPASSHLSKRGNGGSVPGQTGLVSLVLSEMRAQIRPRGSRGGESASASVKRVSTEGARGGQLLGQEILNPRHKVLGSLGGAQLATSRLQNNFLEQC